MSFINRLSMNWVCRAILGLISVVYLNGCMSVNAVETRNLEKPDQPFQRALYVQYAELALREIEEGNVTSAELFDRKARLAAAGENVAIPSVPDSLSVDAKLVDLNAGQKALQKHFTHQSYLHMPVVSARAQAMLDCWIEELDQGVDIGDIAACRQAFGRAIAVLNDALSVKNKPIK